jgi:hypothetical protein
MTVREARDSEGAGAAFTRVTIPILQAAGATTARVAFSS